MQAYKQASKQAGKQAKQQTNKTKQNKTNNNNNNNNNKPSKQNMHSKTSNSDSSSPPSAKKRADALARRTTSAPPSPDVTLTTGTRGHKRCTGSAVYFATRNLPMHLHNATSVGDRGSQTRCAHRRRRLFFSHAPVPGASSFPNGKSVSALKPGLTRSLRLTTVGMVETSRRALAPCPVQGMSGNFDDPAGGAEKDRGGAGWGRGSLGWEKPRRAHSPYIART